MKKIISYLFFAAVLCTSCTDYGTLDDTRVPEVAKATVALNNVTVNKYDATFNVSVSAFGEPKAIEAGVVISTESEPTADNGIVLPNDTLVSEFELTSTFDPATTYQVRAYVISSNSVVYSDIKSFTTESHPLIEYIGKKTLSAYEYNTEGDVTVTVTLSPDADDETILYLNGLQSCAGVDVALGTMTIIIDKEAGTATIPAGQVVKEADYGNYQYAAVDPNTGKLLLTEDIVGTCKNGIIHFDYFAAVIIEGGNAGLTHLFMEDIQIGNALKSAQVGSKKLNISLGKIK